MNTHFSGDELLDIQSGVHETANFIHDKLLFIDETGTFKEMVFEIDQTFLKIVYFSHKNISDFDPLAMMRVNKVVQSDNGEFITQETTPEQWDKKQPTQEKPLRVRRSPTITNEMWWSSIDLTPQPATNIFREITIE